MMSGEGLRAGNGTPTHWRVDRGIGGGPLLESGCGWR
jgi:hypothetical protein